MKYSVLKIISHCLISISVVCALLIATYTFAQEASQEFTTTTSREPARVDGDTPIDRQEIREVRKAALERNIQERIINLTQNVIDRLNAGIHRMENIAVRLESRITKMKTEGYNTAAAEAKLENAQSMLRVAKTVFSESRSAQQAVSSDNPREAFKEIRAQVQGAQELLKQTHALLKETVALLRVSIISGINTPIPTPTEESSRATGLTDEAVITQ